MAKKSLSHWVAIVERNGSIVIVVDDNSKYMGVIGKSDLLPCENAVGQRLAGLGFCLFDSSPLLDNKVARHSASSRTVSLRTSEATTAQCPDWGFDLVGCPECGLAFYDGPFSEDDLAKTNTESVRIKID